MEHNDKTVMLGHDNVSIGTRSLTLSKPDLLSILLYILYIVYILYIIIYIIGIYIYINM